jgi:hypothetical protein
MQKARGQACPEGRSPPTACRHVVSGSFPPLVGVLFTFRSRYLFTIGRQRVLSLAGWAPPLHARFLVTGATQESDPRSSIVAYGAVTRSGPASQPCSANAELGNSDASDPTTPRGRAPAVWADPRSLAATEGVDVSFPSAGY